MAAGALLCNSLSTLTILTTSISAVHQTPQQRHRASWRVIGVPPGLLGNNARFHNLVLIIDPSFPHLFTPSPLYYLHRSYMLLFSYGQSSSWFWRQACFSSRRKVQTLTWTLKGKMQTVAWLPGAASSTTPTQPPDTLSHAGTVASRSSEESKFAHVVCILEPGAGLYRCCARYGVTILIIGRDSK